MITFLAKDLEPVRKLFENGLYLQALEAASQLGPLEEWSGGVARVLAGRLARQVGAHRMGQGHHLLAWREDSNLPQVKYYYVLTISERRGPYVAWQLLKKCGDLNEASPRLRSHWYALHAQTATVLRDFDTAETWLSKADSIVPDDAWLSVVRSGVLHFEDRYQESLDAALQALSLRPWYRPAVQAVALAQIQLGHDEEALSILTEADIHIESAFVVLQELALLIELQRYQEAKRRIERLVELMPLMEKEVAQWLAGLQSEVAYFLNDIDSAISLGHQSDKPFLKKVAENLMEPGRRDAERMSLPLPFIRQHYQTCVPATLTIISRFWERPAEHLEIADQICYNGTTAYSERKWAEQNNWLVREFTVTEDSLTTLINLGVPFTLTTISPGNAHMQAAKGYDARRGTVLIRDPYFRQTAEALIEEFLEDQAAAGPRGMALVPFDMRERLDTLELPDDEHWDQLHQFDGALERHRWPEAEHIYQDMLARAPSHRLTLQARLRLAIYDANAEAQLAALESLLERYPDDESLKLARLSCLSALGRRDDLLASYKAVCAKKDAPPVFTIQYAQELAAEAREQDRAIGLLYRAMRQWPAEAGSYYVLANILWQRQRYEDALELYRFAICLKDKEEDIARAYFEASRFLRQDEEALEFLKRRWERLKNQSSMTGRTLAWAYSQLGRYPEAVAVLDASMTAHPEDGELMLEVANLVTQQSSGDHARAVDLLAAARPLAPRRTWLRTAARMAAVQGNASQTLDYWQQLLKIQPLAMDAHDAAVSLLATTQNQEAAADHLQAYTVQFPHYYPLHLLQVEWYRQTSQVEAYLAAARKLVQLAPQNDASLVYLGDAQLLHDEPEQAYEAFNSAIELNPANSRAGLFLFDLQLQQDNLSAAEETLKIVKHYSDGPITTTKAIRLAIRRNEVDLAAGGLKRLCVTPDESGLALQIAINDLSDAGLDQLISETMDEAIEWPDALPEVGVYWMSACIAFGKPGCVRQLRELVSRGAIGERALEIYLISLVRSGQPGRLRDFVKRNRFWLAENAATCTLAAGALKDIGDSSEAMEWAQDLLNLQGLRPWMLTTPVELFWDAGQMDRVVEISKQALLLPPDRMTLVHRIWLAAVEAFSGDAESALDRLGLVDSMRLDPLSYFLYIMTDAVARISVAPVSQRRQVFRDIRKQVQQAFQETKDSPQVIATQRRFYRQSLKFIGREVGDIRVWIWCYWQILLS